MSSNYYEKCNKAMMLKKIQLLLANNTDSQIKMSRNNNLSGSAHIYPN